MAENTTSGNTGNTGAGWNNAEQELAPAEQGGGQMSAPLGGAMETSGEMSNMDDVAGFGPEGEGGLHGTPPGWFGTPLAHAEREAEQGGNPPASAPVAEQSGPNDWRVSAGESAAADQEPATGTEPPGTFGPVGPGQRGDLGRDQTGKD